MGASDSRRGRFARGLALAVGGFAAACAGRPLLPGPDSAVIVEERRLQYSEASGYILEQRQRAADVGTHVARAGAELCRDKTRASLGVIALGRSDLAGVFGRQGFWREFNDAFAQKFELAEQVRVLHVTPDGPAGQAGIEIGDVIVSLEGRPVRDRSHLASLQRGVRDASFELRIERGGTASMLQIEYAPECWYDLRIVSYAAPNAFATGREILVTTGLLRFIESDDELALVIGHEFAHNQLGHAVKSFKRSEREADYVGCYFAARAGYDVGRAIDYRRRLSREFPAVISEDVSYAHSGTASRAGDLLETIEEIRRKQSAGAPLVPNALA